MGQKIHPGGLRLGIIHDWKSNWYTGTKEFPAYIIEDVRIRDHINGKLGHAGLSDILIRKDKQRITIDIFTARPGIVIGKSGSEVDALRREIHAMTEKNVHININEIKRPELDARLVAQSIAEQLQNRVSFRRAMKRSLASAMRSGAQGVKIQCGGRLGGTEMSRSEHYSEGRVPLHTLRADIDYGFVEAKTTFGRIGVKVWINKGEIMPEGYGDGGRDGGGEQSSRRRPSQEGLSAGREGGRRAPDREGLGPVRRRERSGRGRGAGGGKPAQGGQGRPRPQGDRPQGGQGRQAPPAAAPETPKVETPAETPVEATTQAAARDRRDAGRGGDRCAARRDAAGGCSGRRDPAGRALSAARRGACAGRAARRGARAARDAHRGACAARGARAGRRASSGGGEEARRQEARRQEAGREEGGRAEGRCREEGSGGEEARRGQEARSGEEAGREERRREEAGREEAGGQEARRQEDHEEGRLQVTGHEGDAAC